MATVIQQRALSASPLVKWIPLLVLGLAAAALAIGPVTPWALMWALAVAVFVGLKCLTLWDVHRGSSTKRRTAYVLGWPGLDADAFLNRSAASPQFDEFIFAAGKTVLGLALLFAAAQLSDVVDPLLVGWAGMIGIVFILHFGLFHLLSCFWRSMGIAAQPIMRAPLFATSLSDFWGRRWNTAFRDVAQRHVFRPMVRRYGPAGATLGGFVFSGLIHDLVISLPARAGWGLPTLYFMIQGFALLAERSLRGSGCGLGREVLGRIFTLLIIALPLPLLFHAPFIERVLVPMLQAVKEVLP